MKSTGLQGQTSWQFSVPLPDPQVRKFVVGRHSQSYGFSSGHVWMWELDYKENWALKNWCFWTVLLEKFFFCLFVWEDSWESLGLKGDPISQSYRKSVLTIHWKDLCWSWSSNTLATWWKNWIIGKDPDAGKDWRQEEKGTTEDEMVGWHHWLNGHDFEQALGVGDVQGSLACCSPWGHRESDMTERLNWTKHEREEVKEIIRDFLNKFFFLKNLSEIRCFIVKQVYATI